MPMKFSTSFISISLITASLALAGCATSPTGRSQIIMFSDAEMAQLGAQSFEELKKQEKVS